MRSFRALRWNERGETPFSELARKCTIAARALKVGVTEGCGEVYLELDDGAEVRLKAGDCVIQNGTHHAWHNRSSEKCVISVAIVGAERKL